MSQPGATTTARFEVKMTHRSADLEIPVVIRARIATPAPVLPRHPFVFAIWMSAASMVAVAAGLVLGILAATEASIGGSRWTPSVQAHGRLQLFGFVATFVVALALEFLIRLNGRPAFSARVRIVVPALLGGGALALAAGQVWHDTIGALAYAGGAAFLCGALSFAVLTWRIPLSRPVRVDPQPLFMRAAAAWLAVAGALALWGVAEAESGVVPLDISSATVEVFLRGFVTLTIIGVGLRAFAGHLGLQPPGPGRLLVVYSLLNASVVAWLLASGVGALQASSWLERIADAAFAAGLVAFVAWFGLLTSLRRARGGPRYTLLIPLAWVGAMAYAALLAATAVLPGGHSLGIYEEGAIRHTYLLGFIVPLMIAMAHVVLARFALGFVPWENALTGGFFLLFAAWPLRTIPFLFESAPSTPSRWLLGIAGLLAMAGLFLVATVCARTAQLATRRARQLARA